MKKYKSLFKESREEKLLDKLIQKLLDEYDFTKKPIGDSVYRDGTKLTNGISFYNRGVITKPVLEMWLGEKPDGSYVYVARVGGGPRSPFYIEKDPNVLYKKLATQSFSQVL